MLNRAVDSPQVADLLASRGYSSLVIQKGNGTYLPTTHLVTAAGPKSCTLTNGLSVE